MRRTKHVRLAAAAVTLMGGLLLGPQPAAAASLDECTPEDFLVAWEAVNDACAAEGAKKARIYNCEYHQDSGYIYWEYSCISEA